MEHIKRIFNSVESDNREELWEKAYSSSVILKIWAFVSMIISIIVVILCIIVFATTKPVMFDGMRLPDGRGELLTFGFVILGITILEYAYIYNLKEKVEHKQIPSVELPIFFAVLTMLSVISSILKEEIINIFIHGINFYLWFVLISTINKIKKLKEIE